MVIQDIPWFSDWLIQYADAWGSFLNTPESFNEHILQTFIQLSPLYAVKDSMIDGRPNAPSGWLTFNQFFARELNPGLRPIAAPADNHTIVSPADCTFLESFAIAADSTIPGIKVKKTHEYASVEDLLEGSAHKSAFANGTFAHYFLNTFSYHRFHLPVSGVVLECRAVHGKVYLDVELDREHGGFNAPDRSEGGYEFSQSRGIVIVDTTDSPYGDIGLVGILPIGMAQVSSVNMTHTVGKAGLKGDEFGYFLFGGSDIIVLFQDGALVNVDQGGAYRHYGSAIATHPGR